jgi:hypothetical protein
LRVYVFRELHLHNMSGVAHLRRSAPMQSSSSRRCVVICGRTFE